MSRSTPLLQVEEVSKLFGSLVAVDGVSFTVGDGEILGVAGPNGAGKTTLLNLISGIPFSADKGRILFGGVRIEAMAAHRIFQLGLARTFQREASFSNLTVEQNVRLAASFGGPVTGHARKGAVEDGLGLFDLAAERNLRAGSLPVYATKRLMLASAVVNRPRLLMLDEPASGLSASERSDIQRLILRMRDEGMAIVPIEQVLPLLFGVSERVMVMDFGRKLVEGAPAEIARNEQVIAAYLGGQREAAIHALPG